VCVEIDDVDGLIGSGHRYEAVERVVTSNKGTAGFELCLHLELARAVMVSQQSRIPELKVSAAWQWEP
jgi:hypothetical protein